MPPPKKVYDALFTSPPIEWIRKGELQTLTLRLIAERLLPAGHEPVMVQGEVAKAKEAVEEIETAHKPGFEAEQQAAQRGAKSKKVTEV